MRKIILVAAMVLVSASAQAGDRSLSLSTATSRSASHHDHRPDRRKSAKSRQPSKLRNMSIARRRSRPPRPPWRRLLPRPRQRRPQRRRRRASPPRRRRQRRTSRSTSAPGPKAASSASCTATASIGKRRDCSQKQMAGHEPGHARVEEPAALRLRDRLHHARDRTRASTRRHLQVLQQRLVIFRQRLERRLGLHLHDLVAAGLQPREQRRQRFAGVLLEVVHQDDALAELVELGHHGAR